MKPLLALLLLSLLPCSALQAEPDFEDTYGISVNGHYSAIADQVVATRYDESGLSLQQKITRLKNLQARIDEKLRQFPDDPLLWFISGLNRNNFAEVQYLMVLKKSGQQKASTDIGVSNYNIARSRDYNNSIRLDTSKPHQLSSSIYATMGYGLSNRQKIKTYSRELALGNPSENESNEWFMHWAKVDALVEEKKLDEAQQALTDFKDLLQKTKNLSSPYSEISARAKSQLAKQVKISDERKSSPVKISKVRPNNIEDGKQLWDWKTWLLISIGVFTFSSVIGASIYFRKI